MKIKKFNESVNDKWTDARLREFVKTHGNLTSILQKYLKLKVTDCTVKEYEDDDDYELYNFFFDKKRQFVIKYIDVEDFTGYDYYRPDNDDVINFIIRHAFKKWTINTLFDHCEKHMYLINTFEKYLRWKENYADDNYCGEIGFFFNDFFGGNNQFMINFNDNENEHNTYNVTNYKEMLEFLNDPDLFLNAIKYNL